MASMALINQYAKSLFALPPLARLAALCISVLSLASLPAQAAENNLPPQHQNRTLNFVIYKDGDPIGTEQYRIETAGADTRVNVHTQTKVRMLFLSFTYAHSRQEQWRDGRLMEMRAQTDDDGTPHTLHLTHAPAGYRLHVDGKSTDLPETYSPLTLWSEAIVRHPVVLSIIDGTPWHVTASAATPATLTHGNTTLATRHYTLKGDIQRDLWYDSAGLLAKVQFRKKGFNITYLRQ
jgi:hypothetical protein